MSKKKISRYLYFKEIQELDLEYYNIIKHFNLNFPKPLNLEKEKEIFFRNLKENKKYNPQIQYNLKEFDLDKLKELKNLKINLDNDLFGFKKLYKERLKTKIWEIECHRNWGNNKSTKYVKLYRGEPSLSLLLKAIWFCKTYKRDKIKYKKISPQELAEKLKEYVYYLTKDELRVAFIEMASKVNIDPSIKTLNINSSETYFKNYELKRLKVHEIGTHYMRYYNANQFIPNILSSGTSNYIETEEGLAVFLEEITQVSSKAQMFIYAGRVIATYYALKMSFYDVFQKLKQFGFKDKEAFAITYRAKRNLNDTSQKGGFTKDYVYFSGYHKVKQYCQKNDIRDLFIGKIKISDIKILRKYIDENKDRIKIIFDLEIQ